MRPSSRKTRVLGLLLVGLVAVWSHGHPAAWPGPAVSMFARGLAGPLPAPDDGCLTDDEEWAR